ncbi:hypothetical protein [Marinobacter sp. V034]|uniref:hypothetical protein n=1 Tax=Marinobacter sp. V034 TaxID=3459610 RepID=UPI004044BC41
MLRSLNAFFVRVGLFGALLFLGACGGGGSGSSDNNNESNVTPAPRAGVYEGVATNGNDDSTAESLLFLSPTGRYLTSVGGGFIAGDITFKGDGTLTATGRAFLSGGSGVSADLPTTGTVTSPQTMILKTESDGTSLTFDFKRDNDASDIGVTLDAIAAQGTYMMDDGANPAIAFTVESNGDLSGSDGSACAFDGALTVPDPSVNIILVDFTASGCKSGTEPDPRNGQYEGTGIFIPDDVGGMLVFGAAAENVAVRFVGE